jgi:hypothetical protein
MKIALVLAFLGAMLANLVASCGLIPMEAHAAPVLSPRTTPTPIYVCIGSGCNQPAGLLN